ncbi:MAG: hypothetical protein VX796_05980 [Pseudomonadota bacterium]|nr:hypothetical protein [Pseudomonadota bacterium]
MSELKATRGPYKVHVNSAGSIEVVIGDGYAWRGDEYLCIGIVTEEQVQGREQKKAIAVAHLIAQSPAMYESLAGAPNPSKYAGPAGFEAERFFAAYQAWMDERRNIMAAARGES